MKGYKRFRVFPGRDLRATRIEVALLDTPSIQRLRNIRQLGQSNLVFPTAEHTRFAHSLGTLYWVAKILSYLNENYFSENGAHGRTNREILAEGEDELRKLLGINPKIHSEIDWFSQLARMYALVHDISHLPFGHTLEDQAGLLPRHDEHPERLIFLRDRLIEEVGESTHFVTGDKDLLSVVEQLIRLCFTIFGLSIEMKKNKRLAIVPSGIESKKKEEEAKRVAKLWEDVMEPLPDEFRPYLSLVHDMVSNTICADLIDYLHRDSLFSGMPWSVDKALLSHMKVVNRKEDPEDQTSRDLNRLGVGIARSGKIRNDVLTAVLALLRARYDITEKIYYHHSKCAADALLEKVIRESGVELDWEYLFERGIGDEGLFRHLEDLIERDSPARQLLANLQRRQIPKAIYVFKYSLDLSQRAREMIFKCGDKDGRTEVEAEIARRCGIGREKIAISCPPRKMQMKEAEALVEWIDGDVLLMKDLPEAKGYLQEVKPLTDRYRSLWSLTVYLSDNNARSLWLSLEACCERTFDRKNDHVMADYIRKRYGGEPFEEVERTISGVLEGVKREATEWLGVADQGGDAQEDRDPNEVVFDAFKKTVDRKRLEHKKVKRSPEPGEEATEDQDIEGFGSEKRKDQQKLDFPGGGQESGEDSENQSKRSASKRNSKKRDTD